MTLKRQKIWAKPFSCTLIADSIATKNDSSTSFVFVFSTLRKKTK